MKKIVAIVGSPKPMKKSSTLSVTESFIEGLAKANDTAETEIIYLNDKNIASCSGCLSCQQTGKCVINDEMEAIAGRMHQADLLVFGSPVHFGAVSSVFQNFIERSLVGLHTFEFMGKAFVTVVTTNGSGEQEVDKYPSKIGCLFGGVKLGSIQLIENDGLDRKKYDRVVAKANAMLAGGKVRPKLINRIYFSSMKNIIRKNTGYFKAEAAIWEKKKWFEKSYKEILDLFGN